LKEEAMKSQWTFLLAGALVLGVNYTTFAAEDASITVASIVAKADESGSAAYAQTAKPFLGGEWEYHEDAGATRIALDENGNGSYPWQNGHVVTTSVSGRRWEGHWSQEGNDREGDFEVHLSEDATEAEGTWWYTRVGTHILPPRERGGDCWMQRLSTVVKRVSTAVAKAVPEMVGTGNGE